MKLGIILQTKEYEKAWNALRFAVMAKSKGHDVKLFLIGEAVECQNLEHEKFDVAHQLNTFFDIGGIIHACGTCLKFREMSENEVYLISTMIDCVEMVEWADKTLTF